VRQEDFSQALALNNAKVLRSFDCDWAHGLDLSWIDLQDRLRSQFAMAMVGG
jgi:hypothetical protein